MNTEKVQRKHQSPGVPAAAACILLMAIILLIGIWTSLFGRNNVDENNL